MTQTTSLWTILKQKKDEGILASIDLLIAEQFLATEDSTEPQAALFCALSAALRGGHLCVHLTENRLFPSLGDEELDRLAWEGAKDLTSALCSTVHLGEKDLPDTPILLLSEILGSHYGDLSTARTSKTNDPIYFHRKRKR